MQRRIVGQRALMLIIPLVVIACGEDTARGPHEIETDTTLVRDPTMVDSYEEVLVTLDDFVIEMPDTVRAGVLAFQATNRGTHEHSLEIEGQGVEQALPDPVDPGNTMQLMADLAPGTYRAYCPIEDHAQRGMEKTITVRRE